MNHLQQIPKSPLQKHFDKVQRELERAQKDGKKLIDFTKSELIDYSHHFLRCGYVLKQIEENKLYRLCNVTSMSQFAEKCLSMNRSTLSRIKNSLEIGTRIVEKHPDQPVTESQIRALRSVVKKDKTVSRDKELCIEKAVELYDSVIDKNGVATEKLILGKTAKPSKKQKPKLPEAEVLELLRQIIINERIPKKLRNSADEIVKNFNAASTGKSKVIGMKHKSIRGKRLKI